ALAHAEMKAANDPSVGAGDAVLRESGRVDAGRSGDIDVEGSAEEAAFIGMRGGPEYENTRKGSGVHLHGRGLQCHLCDDMRRDLERLSSLAAYARRFAPGGRPALVHHSLPLVEQAQADPCGHGTGATCR